MRRLSLWVSPAIILSGLVSRSALAQESIILMPDTQYYSKFSGGVRNVGGELETGHWGNNVPNVYERQILYANQEEGVKAVIHLGDITHYNHPAEWEVARAAESQLSSSIAHTLITGNHDYPYRFDEDQDPLYRETPIDEIFGWNFWADVDEQNSSAGYWGAQREDANGDALPGPLNSYAKFELNGEP